MNKSGSKIKSQVAAYILFLFAILFEQVFMYTFTNLIWVHEQYHLSNVMLLHYLGECIFSLLDLLESLSCEQVHILWVHV